MGWELIGGNPATGSPAAVQHASTAFRQVAELASDARRGLVRDTSQLGVAEWKGTAAETFRADVDDIPARLDEVHSSYQLAASALHTFGDQLESAQREAQAALASAESAAADRDAARRRLDGARLEADSLRAQSRSAAVNLLTVKGQQAAAIDPIQRASLTSPVASAQSRANRLQADLRSAEQAVARHTGSIHGAERRLEEAVKRADAVRKRVHHAADAAIAALKRAEEAGLLPTLLQQKAEQAKDLLVEYGPKLAKALQVVQVVLTVAAVIFPPAAPILLAFSLVCGIAAFGLSAAAYGLSDEGFTNERVLDLGFQLVGIFASGAGLAAATTAKAATLAKGVNQARLLSQAQSWRLTGTIIEGAEEGTEVALAGMTRGPDAAVQTFAAYLIGKGGAAVGGRVLREAVADSHKLPHVSDALTKASRSLADGNPRRTDLGVPVDDLPNHRMAQTLLSGGGESGGGEFLPGNRSRTNDSLLDHAMSRSDVDGALAEALEPATDSVVDDWGDRDEEALDPSTIDIDLNPSPYGNRR
jgi:hypothetical protein